MLRIRTASVEQVPLLLEMILEFATFEKLRDEVTITDAMLERDGFGAQPRFRALIAEWNDAAAGYAICFPIYSTFQGSALFLEDVYVRPQYRDKGIGQALIGEVAAMALRDGCGALRWEVLAWNQPAIDFFKRLGAVFLDDWKAVRLGGQALRRLAEQSKA
ncbi:MAG: N-acetyltransferase family protein [Acidobacteriaceae bacterium]